MRRWKRMILAGLALSVIPAMAQTTVTTSGGTTNTVPLFTGSATLGNSAITQSGTNVGIGTTAPGDPLTVMYQGEVPPTIFGGYSTTTANSFVTMGKIPFFEIIGAGNDNQNPSIGLLQLNMGDPSGTWLGPAAIYLGATNATTASAAGTVPVTNGGILGDIAFFGDDGTNVRTVAANIDAEVYTAHSVVSTSNVPAALNLASHGEAPIIFYTQVAGSYASELTQSGDERMRVDYNGNVGIGTASPGAKLEVDGNIKLTSGSGASITFADGSVQSTAYTGVACGGDYAESVDVKGKKTGYEPGDVLVISGSDGSDVEKSSTPYSTMVAGIYSTKPGLVGRRQTTKSRAKEIPMAMVGIVPTKVSAENGPIQRGDLLVTSSTPGYAMKGTDSSRMLGAVVGKAMGNLESGKGVIEVLVTLQ